ncbi:MAG TPA: hypothetical protein VK907_14375, partial [Phnomibacter sp.]|nr:hypothetical protein [Phnomibacter sp.]
NAILNRGLFYFLENPVLLQELPAAKPLETNYEKLFTTTSLLRIRRKDTTATLFGGTDHPIIIASGRSNSPNFFSFRKGQAILKYMRLSTQFFSMGYFYSEGMRKEGDRYILHKKLEAPYYQPLPKHLRNKDGAYAHSPSTDGRFWNIMDFANRPVSNLKTLETSIIFTEKNGAVELECSVTGLNDVAVTIELCFHSDGKVSGVGAPVGDNYFLEQGMGAFTAGEDTIHFGPGVVTHRSISNLEGEKYSTHFGTLRTPGVHVYLTGTTPFKHTIRFS